MDSNAYKIRDEARARVSKAIGAIKLPKDENGSYTHDDATLFLQRIERELERQLNEYTSSGMKQLTSATPNELTKLKASVSITWSGVIRSSKAKAAKKYAETKKEEDKEPLIATRDDAKDEADRQNVARLATIGNKEGIIEGVRNRVGGAITDIVLKTADATDDKNVDDIEIHKLLKCVLDAAERPAAAAARDEYVALTSTTFDFRLKMNSNVEKLKAKVAKAKGYGIVVGDDVICMIVLANAEWAARQSWDTGEFKDAKRVLRSKYSASHVHDAASLADILKTYAAGDEARDLRRAAAPTGRALAVTEGLSFLEALTREDDDDTEAGEAFAAGSESDSSAETKATSRRRDASRRSSRTTRRRSPSTSRSPSRSPSPRDRGRFNRSRGRGGESSRQDRGRRNGRSRDRRNDRNDDRDTNVTCKHCKKFGRKYAHPHLPEKKCNWNKKSKYWRPEWVADKMGVKYVPRSEFAEEYGGRPAKDDDSASS